MNNKKGFTLVEILAVVAILAILATAAGLGISSTINKQRQKLAYTAEVNVSEAALSFYANKGNSYFKACTDEDGAYVTLSQKDVEAANKFLREKFASQPEENFNQLFKDYSNTVNKNPLEMYELKNNNIIKVKNLACLKTVTVGELIDKGFVTDNDGMCNKASLIFVYRRADAKNTAGTLDVVQESGICKSDKKEERGPVITVTPYSDLAFSSHKIIKIDVTTETTKLVSNIKLYYGWSNTDVTKPTMNKEVTLAGDEKKASGTITIDRLDEVKYLWIKKGSILDDKNNKTSEMVAGPYAFLATPIVTYDFNNGTSSCPPEKKVVFTRPYGKDIQGNKAELCRPERRGYKFDFWTYKDTTEQINDSSIVNDKNDHTIKANWTPLPFDVTYLTNIFSAQSMVTNGVTVTYNPSNFEVTINGTATGNVNFFSNARVVNENEKYEIVLEKVSGSIGTATGNYRFVTEPATSSNGRIGSTSNVTWKDIALPTTNGAKNTGTLEINATGATGSRIKGWLWVESGKTVVFDNYKFKVKVYKKETKNTIFDTPYTPPASPSKTGYSWSKWNNKEDGSGQEITSTTNMETDEAHNIYGLYTINNYPISISKDSYITSFDVNVNGSKKADDATSYSGDVRYGSRVTINDIKYVTGYEFNNLTVSGHFLGTDNSVTINAVTGGSVVINSKAKTYTITLDKNGGTNSSTTSIKTTYLSSTLNPSTITAPTRKYKVSGFGTNSDRKSNGATVSSTSDLYSDYTFNGWYTSNSGGTKLLSAGSTPSLQANVSGFTNASSQWTKDSGTTVYANWTSKAVTLPSINKNGYGCGWTTSPTGKTIEQVSSASYTPSSNTTMYGVCVPNTFTVAYNANGGSGAPSSHTCTYDDTCKLSKTKPTFENGTFNKWNTKSDCSGTNYDSEDSVKNATATNGATVTYYACYKCNAGYKMVNGKCVIKTYSVIYSATGASNVPDEQIKTHNVDLTLSDRVPTKSNVTFNGWKDTFDVNHKAGGKYTRNSDTTMTANWCDNCSLPDNSHATCDLDASTPGTCTYNTACESGYVYDSGKNTKSPKCKCSDSTNPTVSNVNVTLASANSVTVSFSASDTGCSGLQKYEISIAGKTETITNTATKTITISNVTTAGIARATVTAYDGAGNHSSGYSDNICIPVSYKLKSGTYAEGAYVDYICERWVVIKDNGTSTTLVRKAPLNKSHVQAAGISITDNAIVQSDACGGAFCLMAHCAWSNTNPLPGRCWVKGNRSTNTYNVSTNDDYVAYDWNISNVRAVIVRYFHDTLLEEAANAGALTMFKLKSGRFASTAVEVNNYIRIPSLDESKYSVWPTKVDYNTGGAWTYVYKVATWPHHFAPVNLYGNTALKVHPVVQVAEQ